MIEKKVTNQQILEKALNEAVKNGFKGAASWKAELIINDSEFIRRFAPILIFNHDFAKALWPEDGFKPVLRIRYKAEKAMIPSVPRKGSWQYHLQRMVVAEDPIKYLGQNI